MESNKKMYIKLVSRNDMENVHGIKIHSLSMIMFFECVYSKNTSSLFY